MANVVKKLNLVRETVRTLNARTGMRAGMMKVQGDGGASVVDDSVSTSKQNSNGNGGNGSYSIQPPSAMPGNDRSSPQSFSQP